jgi:hypothetical protein
MEFLEEVLYRRAIRMGTTAKRAKMVKGSNWRKIIGGSVVN